MTSKSECSSGESMEELDATSGPLTLKDALEGFQCPYCRQLPLVDVLISANGHSVCKTCVDEKKPTGAVKMKPPFIKNKAWEKELEELRILCPFTSEGCSEILSRSELQPHQDTCKFHDPSFICRHLFMGESCEFRITGNNLAETRQHFLQAHVHATNVIWRYGNRGSEPLWIYLEGLQENVSYPVLVTLGPSDKLRYFLLIINKCSEEDRLTFMALNLNESFSVEGEIDSELELTVDGTQYSYTVPTFPLEWAADVEGGRGMPLAFLKSVLENADGTRKNYLRIMVKEKTNSSIN